MQLPFIFSTSQGQQITIDRAALVDCAGVSEVKIAAVTDSYAPFIEVADIIASEKNPEKYHWLLQEPFNQELAFHVARDANGTVLGFAIAMPKVADQQLAWRVAWAKKDYKEFQKMLAVADSSIIWIDQLFMLAASRGKGIGRKLLQSVTTEFPHAQKMQLYVGEFNKIGLGFYERVGFKRIERSVAKDGQGRDRLDLQGNPLYHWLMEVDITQLVR